MKKKIFKHATAAILIFLGSHLFAQPGGNGGGQGQGGPPPAGAPIDNGAFILLLGVAGYAYAKLKNTGALIAG